MRIDAISIGAKVPQGTILAGRELAAFKRQKADVDALLTAGVAAPSRTLASLTAGPNLRTASLR